MRWGDLPLASASLWPPGRHTSVHTSARARMERRHSLWSQLCVCAYLIRPINTSGQRSYGTPSFILVFSSSGRGCYIRAFIRAWMLVRNAVFCSGTSSYVSVRELIRPSIRAVMLVWYAVVCSVASGWFSLEPSPRSYDRPYDLYGRMLGRLLFCLLWDFVFFGDSCGVSSNTTYRHISRLSDVSTTHSNFAHDKGLISTTSSQLILHYKNFNTLLLKRKRKETKQNLLFYLICVGCLPRSACFRSDSSTVVMITWV